MNHTHVFQAPADLEPEIDAVARRRWVTCKGGGSLVHRLLGLNVQYVLEGPPENLAVARREVEEILDDDRNVKQW